MSPALGPWSGVLDLDRDDPAAPAGLTAAGHSAARFLVRLHGAPVGQVTVAVAPEATLTARARAAAETELAGVLSLHAGWDAAFDSQDPGADWAARVACPQRAARPSGAGLSVVICTRDRPGVLADCLQALARVAYDPVEFVVVDNAPSGTRTRALVAGLAAADPRFRYTCEPAPGLSRARNHGVAAARYDLIAFTDDDVTVDPLWPAALAAAFAADPGAACVTGLVAARSLASAAEQYFDARYPWGEAFLPRRYDLAANRDPARLYPFAAGTYGTGANFAVRREITGELGGFDPVLGAGGPCRGGEDLDFFVRVILAGHRICYTPAALAWHRHRASQDALARQVYSYGTGLGGYLAKQLVTGAMPVSFLLRAAGHSAVLLTRMRQASQASQLRSRGRQLAVSEALGVAAGAVRYCGAARREPRR